MIMRSLTVIQILTCLIILCTTFIGIISVVALPINSHGHLHRLKAQTTLDSETETEMFPAHVGHAAAAAAAAPPLPVAPVVAAIPDDTNVEEETADLFNGLNQAGMALVSEPGAVGVLNQANRAHALLGAYTPEALAAAAAAAAHVAQAQGQPMQVNNAHLEVNAHESIQGDDTIILLESQSSMDSTIGITTADTGTVTTTAYPLAVGGNLAAIRQAVRGAADPGVGAGGACATFVAAGIVLNGITIGNSCFNMDATHRVVSAHTLVRLTGGSQVGGNAVAQCDVMFDQTPAALWTAANVIRATAAAAGTTWRHAWQTGHIIAASIDNHALINTDPLNFFPQARQSNNGGVWSRMEAIARKMKAACVARQIALAGPGGVAAGAVWPVEVTIVFNYGGAATVPTPPLAAGSVAANTWVPRGGTYAVHINQACFAAVCGGAVGAAVAANPANSHTSSFCHQAVALPGNGAIMQRAWQNSPADRCIRPNPPAGVVGNANMY